MGEEQSGPCGCFRKLFPTPRSRHPILGDLQRNATCQVARCGSLSNSQFLIVFSGSGEEFLTPVGWDDDPIDSVAHFPDSHVSGQSCYQTAVRGGHCDWDDHFFERHAVDESHSSEDQLSDYPSDHPCHIDRDTDCLPNASHRAAQRICRSSSCLPLHVDWKSVFPHVPA